MNWIDGNLAVGDIGDCTLESRQSIQEAGIDLIMDVRHLFDPLSHQPIREKAGRFVQLLDSLTREGWKILIHCHGGIDRSPFIAMLYVVERYGLYWTDAYAKVEEKRPQTITHWEWIKVFKK